MAQDILDQPQAGDAAVRGGALRVAGYAVGVVLTVVSAAILFRHLGVVDSGRYVTVLALSSLVAGMTEFGLTTVGIRELAVRDQAGQRILLANLLGLRLAVTLVGAAAAVVFALIAGYDGEMVVGVALAGIALAGIAIQTTLGISLMVRLRLGWMTALELIRQAVLVAGIVVLVLLGAGIVPFVAAQIPAVLVALALTIVLVRGSVPLRPAFDAAEWGALLRTILPFAAATILAAVYFRASLLVLELVSTPREVGLFSAPFRITEVLLAVPNLLVGAAFPIFSRAARDDRARLAYGLDRVFQASLTLGACALVGLVLGAPFVIDVVAGARFDDSVDVLRLQAVALLISFAATPLTYSMLSLRMHGSLLVVSAVALAANIISVAILASAHGAMGAAGGAVIAEVIGLACAWLILRRSEPGIAPGLGPVARVAVATVAGLAVGLIPSLPAVVAAMMGVGAFTVAAYLCGAIPPELISAFLHRDRHLVE
ncbi:MAG TPA: oligosaccharide flippase family protein [Thermoleophilaceae bacterium]|nr:oligosaccharide flippase family protein [Thermoleophilaceae bacterium]